MSDPYNSNGLPDPPRADAAGGAPVRMRPARGPRRAEAPLGEVFQRGLIAWNALALVALPLLPIFAGGRSGLSGFLFFGWPFLLALAVRFWVSSALACLIVRGLTALWSLPLLMQLVAYAQAGIPAPKTLFLLTMAILLALNAIFLEPAEPRD